MPPKRKRSSAAAPADTVCHETPIVPPNITKPPAPKRHTSHRGKVDTNPDHNAEILDSKAALRASPDADGLGEALDAKKINGGPKTPAKVNGVKTNGHVENGTTLLEPGDETPAKKLKKSPTKSSIAAKKGSDEIKAFKAEQAARKAAESKVKKEEDGEEWDKRLDPDGDETGPAEDLDVVKKEAERPPPVNSDYLPLPWKGRLGYACLNTYLRFSSPPVFTSRTCRIASILEHRHPLADPAQPEHATKNRPDKFKLASIERGQKYVEDICLANVRDLPKMFRWNDKYGIKFMRLSSEMFPFASHLEYGYKLTPFASEALAEAGKVVADLGHRVSTHPGQFTQLGSPRKEVIANAVRDLEYHDEMLSLLKLPEQQDRDAVMILHMGGVFGDRAATLTRFKDNYTALSENVKRRIVLENDDVSYSVHDLLPVCEELNIPLCLDFHHHNIIFDSSQLREGTLDITKLYPRIKATWDQKGMTQKMHYSEPCPDAITGRQRRKHNPRPITLPPCANDMDLMIEAKDKEQAVFELMRTLKLPGYDTFNNIIPYERTDDNKIATQKTKKKKSKKQKEAEIEEFGRELSDDEEDAKNLVPEEEIGMGGKENRVYWPQGMEEWLRPKKREVKKKGAVEVDEDEMFRNPTPANFAARKAITERNNKALDDDVKARLNEASSLADVKRLLEDIREKRAEEEGNGDGTPAKKAKTTKKATPKKKVVKREATPVMEDGGDEEDEDLSMPDLSEDDGDVGDFKRPALPERKSQRSNGKRKIFVEPDAEDD